MKGMKVMYSYKGKIAGVVISALGFAALLIEKSTVWLPIKKYNHLQHLALFQWITLLGLFTIAYSKEKYDDDRAHAIRLKSLQIAFALQQAVVLAMALTGSLHPEPMDYSILFAMAAIGIIMYLLLFHFGLYFDELWDFDDKSTLANKLKNIQKNKWSLLVYLVISAVMMLLLTLFE